MKTEQITKIISGVIVAGVSIFAITKAVKERKRETDEEKAVERKTKEEVSNLGINPDTLEKKCADEPENLIRTLFTGVALSSDWDKDFLKNADLEQNVIHVMETASGRRNQKQVDFLFQFPDSCFQKKGSKFRFGALKRAIDDSVLVGIQKMFPMRDPWTGIELWATMIGVDEDGKRIQTTVKVDQSIFERFKTERNNGAVEFYTDFLEKGEMLKDDSAKIEAMVCADRGMTGCDVVDLYLAYRISLPSVLVTIKSGMDILKMAVDAMDVSTGYNNVSYSYDHLTFNPDGDLSKYYEMNNGEIIVSEELYED